MYAIADTHAVIWYLLADARLSETARQIFAAASASGNPIGVPSIAIVEMLYLTEKNRIPSEALEKLGLALQAPDSVLSIVPLDEKIAWDIRQVNRNEIPELPDRIIAATAASLNLPLITRDEKIRASKIETIW